MRFLPPPIIVEEHEGFTEKKDLFGRKSLGRGLTNVLLSSSDSLVIALDGEWGTGKTVFLQMWAGSLRNEGFPVIYFDAFANDYIDDAFTALAGEVVALAQRNKSAKKAATKKFIQKAVGAGKVILRGGVKVGVKIATLGALQANDLGDVVEDIADEMADAADEIVGKAITEKKAQQDAILEFREALSLLPNLLSTQAIGGAKKTAANGEEEVDSPKPLIFMIDELDRCRPNFALEILERIKHFFNVPNVHFVLGTHLKQLENAIAVTYGAGINAPIYLQKFVHLHVYLHDHPRYDHERTATKFIAYLREAMNPGPEHAEIWHYTLEHLEEYANKNDISLRTIERLTSTVAIALAFSKKNYFRPPPLLSGLCLMKVLAPELFRKAKNGTLTYEEANHFLKFKSIDEDFFSSWWAYALLQNPPQELMRRFSDVRFNYNMERLEQVRYIANQVVDRLIPIDER